MLYIIATPIGNLEDITLRALRILKEVDAVLCEDTRVTKKLLAHYNIQKPLLSYHQHSSLAKAEKIVGLLAEDKSLALVSDAGTPGISDPGNELIAKILESDIADRVEIVPIPGPAALVTLASVAGIYMDRFTFLGFPPHKKGRVKYFERVLASDIPVLFYESSHRILKSLTQLAEQISVPQPPKSGEGSTNNYLYGIVVGRELTKKFEVVYRGTPAEVLAELEKEKMKGEFVVIVYKARLTPRK